MATDGYFLYIDSDACPISHSSIKVLLGCFIITGVMVSYFPQIHKIASSRSSAGLSIYFLFLGAIGCFSTIGNVILLQYNSIVCCTTEWSLQYCMEDTLGITQVSVQLCGFCIIVVLFYLNYPVELALPLVTFSEFEGSESTGSSAAWRRIKGIGAMIIVYAIFVVISLVSIFQIQDPQIFIQVRLWWAGILGVTAASSGVVQFVPQIIHTWKAKSGGALSVAMLAMQCPGSFVFAFSLAVQPGTNWTTWVSFLVGGTLQAVLLFMCLYYNSRTAHVYTEVLHDENPVTATDDHIDQEQRSLLAGYVEEGLIIHADDDTTDVANL
ncbi:hypothetical protein O5D80_007265 [Batrachochytrium dendrobatidis]|nr:hypothetical protein O5D80_007265 [Batrachochytrium dendrobatidis]